nr:hypothetical protein [Tanacetum cinerariifolium]
MQAGKKKFLLIDRRVIPDVIPWRRRNSDVSDNFLANYNESNADLVVAQTFLLRKPPITMENFLYLPDWTGTVVSKGDPIPEDQRYVERTNKPLQPEVPIPDETPHQKVVEKAD